MVTTVALLAGRTFLWSAETFTGYNNVAGEGKDGDETPYRLGIDQGQAGNEATRPPS
jgi:hypothetical protein